MLIMLKQKQFPCFLSLISSESMFYSYVYISFFYWEEAKVLHVSVAKRESSNLSGFSARWLYPLHVKRPKRVFIINVMF